MSNPDSIAATSDPYPDRFHSAAGVRVVSADAARLNGEVEFLSLPEFAPFPLAASVELDQRPVRSGRFPVAAVVLSSLAQCVLAAVIANRVVPAWFGALAAVVLLLAGMALIAAQCLTGSEAVE